ncbi:AP endonuclease family 1 domain protein [Devosia sp. LC5]|uniref:endonuclease/exonuclease/phosphatase family protein n=1 Tax=Devosia sp. LC5 TaxID=1502724 RepID=UPI0004E2D248|nr:endonuclease/exonuclease/phosphatase family protein [Devosia sp. LC5]KFC62708.1 AP endonuclease family 1 domain protein [Devosia sp. LC5]
MKPELRGSVTILAILAMFGLAAASFDLPVFNPDVLQSLRFHWAAACLALPIALFMLGARWRGVLILALILASIGQGAYLIHRQQAPRSLLTDVADTDGFTVMSFNVLATSDRGQDITDYMIELAPDIAVILETPGIERNLDRLAGTFPYHIGCENSLTCDLSLFSRTPLVNAQMHLLGEMKRERLISARTIIDGRLVTIVALHLSKPYFDGMSIDELWQITRLLQQIEGPVLVSGDFNSAAWSSSVLRFVNRNDLVPPPRYPSTWPVRLAEFGVPIDNMFTRGALRIDEIGAMPSNFGSNHRGLLAQVNFATAAEQAESP